MKRFLSGLTYGFAALGLISLGVFIANKPATYLDLRGTTYFDPSPNDARAAQGSACMPTTGTVSGLVFAQAVNTGMAALISSNSGNSAPANDCSAVAVKGQWWVDTSATPNLLKNFNGTQWVTLGALDTIWAPPVGGGVGSLASAATTDLGSVPNAYVNVTGTTTITSFGSSAVVGSIKYLKFGSALTLTHNATSLIIPAGVNLSLAANDQITVVHLGAGNWGVASVTKQSGEAVINPAIEVGSYQMYGGFSVPTANYLVGDGTAVSRATYPVLLARYSLGQNGTRTNTSPTIASMADTSQFGPGQAVEGTGIQAGSTIVSKTATSITLTLPAVSSGTSTVTVFAYGGGNGTTTFNLPNCQGRTLAGQEATATLLTTTYFGAVSGHASTQLGGNGGNERHQLTVAQIPAHNHTSPSGNDNADHTHTTNFARAAIPVGTPSGNEALTGAGVSVGVTSLGRSANHQHSIASQGGDGFHPIVMPAIISKCLVRVQ